MDPGDKNKAILRECAKMPFVEQIFSQLTGTDI